MYSFINFYSEMESFLLKHAALIEAMVCRARAGTEVAYAKPGCFASLMCDIHQEVGQFLCDLLTGSTLDVYLWHEIGDQPHNIRIKSNSNSSLFSFTKTKSESNLTKFGDVRIRKSNNRPNIDSVQLSNSELVNNSFKASVNRSFSGFLKSDTEKCDSRGHSIINLSVGSHNQSSHYADSFIKELCELLELVEVKQTNL